MYPYDKVYVLTGVIGSGKSTVAQMLKSLGANIVSADEIQREVTKRGSPTLEKIRLAFGDEYLQSNGDLNRKELGRLVFNNPSRRLELERITHPPIRELAEQKFKDLLGKSDSPLIYDCPLYYEAELESLGFKGVIVAYAPEPLCIVRVSKRDAISEEQVAKRMQAQFSIEKKKALADFIIDNSGSIEETLEQVKKLFSSFSSNV